MGQSISYLDKPWLKSYKLGPYRLEQTLAPQPREPVFSALDRAADLYPTQTAVLFLGRSISYAQLRNRANRLASALVRLGVQRGDRVCLFLPNSMEFILGDWAILKAGAAVVPTSILRRDDGLLHEVASSNARVVICQEDRLEQVRGIRDRSEVEHIIVTSCAGYDVASVQGSLPAGVHDLTHLIAEHEPVAPPVVIDPEQDLCELAFTGGATGIPKGVMLTHQNRMSAIRLGFPWSLKSMLRAFVGKASCFIAMPMFHVMGHYAHQAAAYLGLRNIVLPDPRDIELMVETIREYRPFLIPAIPTQLMRIAQADLGRLNSLLLTGAAPLPAQVADDIRKKTGMPVTEAYGLTETAPLTHLNLSGFAKITGFAAREKPGIGVPVPDTECRLVHPETGQDVPLGEPGELILRGPQVMKGYWPTPGLGLTPEGWFHTGDIAVMDEEGYFQLVDRIKDMVNISGMKVYTTTVDEVLFRHPGVLMAAAFGVPDPKVPASERVMAVIQLKEDFKGQVSVEDIRSYCRACLAPYAVPTFVEFRDQLPLTVTEKVFKKALREEAIQRMKEGGTL